MSNTDNIQMITLYEICYDYVIIEPIKERAKEELLQMHKSVSNKLKIKGASPKSEYLGNETSAIMRYFISEE